MKLRLIGLVTFALVMQLLVISRVALADKLQLKDGQSVEGIVKKIEKGQVTVEVGGETKVFDVLDITGIDFDTPRLATGTSRLPLEHFLASMEAQEMVGHIEAVEKASADLRELIAQTKLNWMDHSTISASEVPKWDAAKEKFRKPLSRYQETLNDLYFHVLGKVDEYARLVKDANQLYVGVEGVFNVGSSLVPKDMQKLPLKKYVPGNWYDTIFFEGYDSGYSDAVEKYRKEPY